MKRNLKLFVTLVLGATMMFSCQQAEDPTMDQGAVPETRAYGDTPVVVIYVETNDTNPLNAGDSSSPTANLLPALWNFLPRISTSGR